MTVLLGQLQCQANSRFSQQKMSDDDASEDEGMLPMRYSSGNTSATLSKSTITHGSKGSKGKPMATVAVVREPEKGKDHEKRPMEIHVGSLAATIRNVVTRELFSKIKFVQNRELEWSDDATALCHRVSDICHIHHSDREVWWRSAARHVKRSIADIRAQKTGQIRVAFMCKSIQS